MRRQRAALVAALTGRITAHHRLLLGQHLAHIAFLDAQIAAVAAAIGAHPAAQAALVACLATMPGVGRQTAEVILAAVGANMARFPSADHLTSGAGRCPGQDESAGKRRSGKTRQGNRALRTALVEAAKAAGLSKDTALGRRYRRLQPRLGGKKATIAIARQILEAVYSISKEGTPYRAPTPPVRGPLTPRLDQRHHVQALQALGYHVILHPLAA